MGTIGEFKIESPWAEDSLASHVEISLACCGLREERLLTGTSEVKEGFPEEVPN